MGHMLACLVDVYGTLLEYNYHGIWAERASMAGVEPEVWNDAYGRIVPTLGVGQMSMAEAFAVALRTCGVPPRDELVRRMVSRDHEMLLATAKLYPDSMPFLELLRSRGIAISIVSNCNEHTRALLISLGIAAISDSLVLSCEVGWIKPSPLIFRHALEQLGVPGSSALFVDDQLAFCAGSEALGIKGVQIVRDGDPPSGGVRSLLDLADLL
jgi:HAD superfamily hydrolase (TIGR01509 family)